MLLPTLSASAALIAGALASPLERRSNFTETPIVDLGYALQQGIYNSTFSFYNFTNIRYAAAPTGLLRWRAPEPPITDRTTVKTSGSYPIVCPPANPAWSLGVDPTGLNPLNVSLPLQSPGATEDCLFLDVFVPKEVFESETKDAAVMVWIYGGGFTAGSKTGSGTPVGLLRRSEEEPNAEGVIYVALNYRLGALGWLSSEEVNGDGVSNAGLYDQRFALEWVRTNIHLFGGSGDKVTVFGESAGGASIMHQITAYGGRGCSPTPFQKAIIQSPGWDLSSGVTRQIFYQNFLSLLNVTTLEQARELPSSAVILANYRQVYVSEYGSYTFGPVVGGEFVPESPLKLLANGSFNATIDVMVGHNADEGYFFVPSSAGEAGAFEIYIAASLPGASNETIAYISNVLYPPIFDGTYGYTTEFERSVKAFSELVFTCNTFYLSLAYENETFAYEFEVPPAVHGQDVAWTYFDGDKNTPNVPITQSNVYTAVSNVTVAIAFQEYLTSFAQTGNPAAGQGFPAFERYGENARVLAVGQEGVTVGTDDVANRRCRWWQKQEYLLQ